MWGATHRDHFAHTKAERDRLALRDECDKAGDDAAVELGHPPARDPNLPLVGDQDSRCDA